MYMAFAVARADIWCAPIHTQRRLQQSFRLAAYEKDSTDGVFYVVNFLDEPLKSIRCFEDNLRAFAPEL